MSETNGQPLSPGWELARLSDIADVTMGQSPPSSTYNSNASGLPFFQGKAEFGNLYPEARVWCSRPGKIAEKNDILLSVRAPVGPTNVSPCTSCIGRGLSAIRPFPGIDLKFLLYAFRRFAADLDAKGTGTTFKAVSGKVVREFPIPVAPSLEQTRIADALDELLSELDAGVAALERVQVKLKHYRSAILKAAADGSLTAEWRENHLVTESPSTLLTLILAERRRRWEETQLQKFTKLGKEPPKDWRSRYKEPKSPDASKLPPLPSGWSWVSLDQLSVFVTSGSRGWADFYSDKGPMFVRSQDIRTDRLLLNDVARVNPPQNSEGARTLLQKGDLLVTITGANVAKAALVDVEMGEAYVSQHVGLVRLVGADTGRFIHIYTTAPTGGRRLLLLAAYGAGKPGLNLDNLRDLPIPFPPGHEQAVIVETVEDQLSVIEHLEADLETKLKSAQALRHSILRHAFTGQLVPQNPNDEPAAELLKRIAAERVERERLAAVSKKGKARSPSLPPLAIADKIRTSKKMSQKKLQPKE